MRRLVIVALACCALAGCRGPHRSEGERLAQVYCAACHMFPQPALLDKRTWRTGVLPQMAQRLGVPAPSLAAEMSRDPAMVVLTKAVSPADWEKIAGYYLEQAPDTLPQPSLPAQPQLDPPLFTTGPAGTRSEEHTSELQSPIDISYAVFCLKKKKKKKKKKKNGNKQKQKQNKKEKNNE